MMKFFSNKKIVILLISGIILLATFTIYLLYPVIRNNDHQIDTKNRDNIFRQINLKRYKDDNDVMHKILISDDYWVDWGWEDSMIETRIKNVVSGSSEFILEVIRPVDKEFNKDIKRVKINCPYEETISVSYKNPTISLTDGGFDIFTKAKTNDIFYGYCLDKNCLNIGRKCILVSY